MRHQHTRTWTHTHNEWNSNMNVCVYMWQLNEIISHLVNYRSFPAYSLIVRTCELYIYQICKWFYLKNSCEFFLKLLKTMQLIKFITNLMEFCAFNVEKVKFFAYKWLCVIRYYNIATRYSHVSHLNCIFEVMCTTLWLYKVWNYSILYARGTHIFQLISFF